MSQWRELSDDELFRLDAENNRRIQALEDKGAAIGVNMQMQGEREHYLLELLEGLHSERSLAAAREKHALWLSKKLDESEVAAQAQLDQIKQARLQEQFSVRQIPDGPRVVPPAGSTINRGRRG